MTMRPALLAAAVALIIAPPAGGQTSISACGELRDPSSRQVYKVFGDLRVCMIAIRPGAAEYPREWAARASTLVLETQQPGDNRRAALEGNRVTWTVNGLPAALDSVAEGWQRAVIDLLDLSHERDQFRSTASALRLNIDSTPARRAALAARIDSVEREDRLLNRRIMELQSQDRLLRSDIQRTRQAASEMQRRASEARSRANQGDERQRSAALAEAARLEEQAQRAQEQVWGMERREAESGIQREIAAVSKRVGELNAAHTVAYLRLQLGALDSTSVTDMARQLEQLNGSGRLAALDAQVDEALQRLRALLAAR